jgi:hypothetical protein
MQAKPTLSLPRTAINHPRPDAPTLSAKRLKVTAALDAAELATLAVPATSRINLKISLPGRTLAADIAAKSLRKAQSSIAEHGAGNVVAILQGHLISNTIAEAGLTVQVKTPKPSVSESTDSAPPPAAAASPRRSLQSFHDQIRNEIEKRGR